jgi:hypothetical protein
MVVASTLALGQASYDLLDALVTSSTNKDSSITETIRATKRGGTITGKQSAEGDAAVAFSANFGEISTLNVADLSEGLNISDADAHEYTEFTEGLNANINFFSNAENAQVSLGAGDNRFNAARAFTNSTVSALGGSDTVRIGGDASGSQILLGDGDNNVTISRAASDLDVHVGTGDDSLLFLGKLTDDAYGANYIYTHEGSDTLRLIGGVDGNYTIGLGSGDDNVIFGANSISSGFYLETAQGNDLITLGKGTENANITFGYAAGPITTGSDTLVLGVGADITNSTITSMQTGGDSLQLSGYIFGSDFYLGTGADKIDLLGTGLYSSIDLGYDNSVDTVTFSDASGYFDNVINNFGSQDVLIIGGYTYGYNDIDGVSADVNAIDDKSSVLGNFLLFNTVNTFS